MDLGLFSQVEPGFALSHPLGPTPGSAGRSRMASETFPVCRSWRLRSFFMGLYVVLARFEQGEGVKAAARSAAARPSVADPGRACGLGAGQGRGRTRAAHRPPARRT
jgi:hypothetical protein